MAKPNYSFAKRQRDIAKKKKKEDKLRRRAEAKKEKLGEDLPQSNVDGDTAE
jgi:hypothetical protein